MSKLGLNLPSDPSTMLMPASAILFRQDGLEVAVIGDDDKVTLKKISLGRNLGVQVEVTGGLMPTDRVVDSPSDSLGSGDVVRIAAIPPQATRRMGQKRKLKRTRAGLASARTLPVRLRSATERIVVEFSKGARPDRRWRCRAGRILPQGR